MIGVHEREGQSHVRSDIDWDRRAISFRDLLTGLPGSCTARMSPPLLCSLVGCKVLCLPPTPTPSLSPLRDLLAARVLCEPLWGTPECQHHAGRRAISAICPDRAMCLSCPTGPAGCCVLRALGRDGCEGLAPGGLLRGRHPQACSPRGGRGGSALIGNQPCSDVASPPASRSWLLPHRPFRGLCPLGS